MIIHLKKDVAKSQIDHIAAELEAEVISNNGVITLITTSKMKEVNKKFNDYIDDYFVFESDIQLASKDYMSEKRSVKIGTQYIGGSHNNSLMIAGPCSIESEEQIRQSAELCTKLGITTMRAGCFKPRTSPYTFQGMGLEGLKLLAKMREEYGLHIITEIRDATHADDVIEYTDIIQIGAKAMYDHGILRKCGKANKPVLLKRSFGATLQEFVQAAEFILSGGNQDVILCERGIRTFETKTRFTLDLCGVSYLKEFTNLPIILDPTHALGHAYGVADLAKACIAMGIEGLLIETHPNPKVAKSDASQQLDHNAFEALYKSLSAVASAVGRKII